MGIKETVRSSTAIHSSHQAGETGCFSAFSGRGTQEILTEARWCGGGMLWWLALGGTVTGSATHLMGTTQEPLPCPRGGWEGWER